MESKFLLVASPDSLKAVLPNAIDAVKGERSLFDKVAPWIITEQEWLEQNIIPPELIDRMQRLPAQNAAKRMASQLVATLALARNLRALDLVLTPNGFAVVSNSNLAPASRERVDALSRELFNLADRLIENLVTILRGSAEWRQSECASRFASTLFFTPFTVASFAQKSSMSPVMWNSWLDALPDIQAIETTIAQRFLSVEQADTLRAAVFDHRATDGQKTAARLIAAVVADAMTTGKIDYRRMEQIIEWIKVRPEEFPIWYASDVARVYLNPVIFKNDKNASGYFF